MEPEMIGKSFDGGPCAGAILEKGDLISWACPINGTCQEGMAHVHALGDSTITIHHGAGFSTIPRTHVLHRWGQ